MVCDVHGQNEEEDNPRVDDAGPGEKAKDVELHRVERYQSSLQTVSSDKTVT